MDIKPAPDRLVVRLTGAAPGVGAAGQGEIVAIGQDVLDDPKLNYEVGDTVLFGRSIGVPVINVDDDSVVLLGSSDVLGTVPDAAHIKIVGPDTIVDSSVFGETSKLDGYISELRDLAK